MATAPRYKALLLLLILDLLVKNCHGFRCMKSRAYQLNYRLKCAETGPTSIPSTKRSSMNEKMLERAKVLRDEATALESPTNSPDVSNIVDFPEENGIKILRDEFVSRFPVERLTANTSIFTLGAFDSKNITETSASAEYTSVLVERDAEQKKQKLQLDKISGEATRKKRATNTRLEEIADLVKAALNSQLSEVQESAERKFTGTNAMGEEIDYSNVTSIFAALYALDEGGGQYNFSSVANALVKTTDSNGVDSYELQTVDKFLENYMSWLPREAFKLLMSIVYINMGKDSIENTSSLKYLQMAVVSCFLDLSNSDGIDQDLSDGSLSLMNRNYHLRADFFKAIVTKSAPSITELEMITKAENVSVVVDTGIMLPSMAEWRLGTLQRLKSSEPSVVKQREIMWGLRTVPATDAVNSAEMVAPSSVLGLVVDKGSDVAAEPRLVYQTSDDDALALRMNSLYISLVQTGEGRLSDEEGKASANLILAEYRAREKEGPVPPNLVVLMNAISPYASSESGLEELATAPISAESAIGSTVPKKADGRIDLSGMSLDEMENVVELDVDMTEFIEQYVKTAIDTVVEEYGETAAERFLYEYFEPVSRKKGAMISREGAGRFQGEMLKDLFVVSSVKMSQGAVIFDGKYKAKTSAEFVAKLNERYIGSRLAGEVGFIVMMNEKYPDAESGLQQAALDSMLGRSPSVVVYPKNWNNTLTTAVTTSPRRLVKSALSSLAAVSSAAFAASCLDMFNPSSTFMMTGETPEDFLPLAFLPLTIQYASTLAETIAGNLKGFNVTSITVPALSLPTFGSRTVYTSMPKNRNDIFDTAAVGIIVGLSSSLLALFVGLQITAAASAEVAAAYPSVSLALLKTNAIVTQFLSYQLPQAAIVAAETTKKVAIPGGLGFTTIDTSTVHLHWLAIAGAASLIANTYQLIPIDNSAGSKLIQSTIGKEAFLAVSLITGAIKFLFILPLLFTLNAVTATGALSNTRLLVDYFITSQFSGSEEETQTATDNISEVSEGRKIVLLGLMTLFFFSVVPYGEMAHRLFNSISSITEYIKVIATTGAVPVQNRLF